MKLRAIGVCFLLVVSCASVALAGAPLPGNYQSNDYPGGTISPGLYTEGWAPGGGALLAGTTQNCGSWDGATLGGQWRYTCGTQLTNGGVVFDGVVGGNGNRITACTYTGGIFWLSGTGPWANGDASYPGHFDTYVEYESVQYVGGIPIAATTTVASSAHFGGTRVGTTVLGNVMPAYYPAMLAPDCSPSMVDGAWWTMNSLTITINATCATAAKKSSWGAIKAIYR